MQRPALLRFTSDRFMDELTRTLDSAAPNALAARVAQPVSYRARPVGAEPPWTAPARALKLYQPFHGHFNLIACSLVCRIPGLPDRAVESADGERAAFVLRRLDADGNEHAWADDAALGLRRWQPIADPGADAALAPGEELFPLFSLNYTELGVETRTVRPRRLLVGLIPTESREAYPPDATTSSLVPGADDLENEVDARLAEFDARVIAPLERLKAQASADASLLPAEQDATRFLYLDLGELLSLHAKPVWEAIQAPTPPAGGPALALYTTLGAKVDPGDPNSATWREAIAATWAARDAIAGDGDMAIPVVASLRKTALSAAELRNQIAAVLPAAATPATPPAPAPVLPPPIRWVPKFDGSATTRYVVRSVYLRPGCGPLQPPVISAPSLPFAVAPVFDPDAPARSIRIPLPIDTSIKGLRQHSRGVGVLISNQLRQQINSITDLKKALEGDLEVGEPFDLGILCSFSIPIITICALIVLIIFLTLLNIVFWWLPFFRICLPVKLGSD
jgi:hypothetical protein